MPTADAPPQPKPFDPVAPVRIGPIDREHGRLALGCWVFGGVHWAGQSAQDSRAVMEAALRRGMNHFDTAEGYGDGRSETLVGDFLKTNDARRDKVFLATKAFINEPTGAAVRASLDGSLQRLGVEAIDLYYVHWPLRGRDLRPVFEELRKARDEGKIRAIGVSNFNIEQIEAARSVCEIHAHQFCYNLIWRFAEREMIPYCNEKDIAVVAYSAIAQGILTGSFPPEPMFNAGDLRGKTVPFEPEVWPHVYAAVEKMKAVAAQVKRPLAHLAIRWLMRQRFQIGVAGAEPSKPRPASESSRGVADSTPATQSPTPKPRITSVLVGARDAVQVNELAGAMGGKIEIEAYDKVTAISDELQKHLPDTGNIFRFYP